MARTDRHRADDTPRRLRGRVIAAGAAVLGLAGWLAGHVQASRRPRVRLAAEAAERAATRPWDRGEGAGPLPADAPEAPSIGRPGARAPARDAVADPAPPMSGAATAWRCVDDPGRAASVAGGEASGAVPAAVQAAMGRELAALRASPSAVDRAAAIIAAGGLQAVRSPASAGAGPDAAGDEAQAAASAWADGLSRLALATNDATVYGFAARSCLVVHTGTCAAIDAYRWARREPDNAIAWLYVAGEARAAVDPGAELDARAQMARAARVDSGQAPVLHALAAHREPGDAGTEALIQLSSGAFSVMAGWWEPLGALTRACRPDVAQADANLREWCVTTAAHFAARADTLLLSRVGASIQARLSGRTLPPLSADPRYQAQERQWSDQGSGCAGDRRRAEWLAAEGRLGERGVLEAAAAAEAASGAAR